ncbi:MAG: hypothetical protein U0531_01560 [Dehalococcoidia bacterium]
MATKRRHGIALGWGACSISGCPCRGYQQTYGSELCQNCGHNFTAHW